MKRVCGHNPKSKFITDGKGYNVIREIGGLYKVICDDGKPRCLSKKNFFNQIVFIESIKNTPPFDYKEAYFEEKLKNERIADSIFLIIREAKKIGILGGINYIG